MELNDLDVTMNQFINGKLTGKALQDFEQLLLNNDELAKEVTLHKTIDRTLKATKNYKSKSALNELFQQYGEQYILNEPEQVTKAKVIELQPQTSFTTEKSKAGMVRWLAPLVGLAAAALLIFFIGFGETNPQQLAEQYYKPYTFDATFRSDKVDNLVLAQQAYDKKEYKRASDLLSQYPDNIAAQMAKGNCEFLLNEPENAIATFEKLSNKKIDVNVKAQAQWYLALSYLELGDKVKASKSLQLIAVSSNYYNDAQTILKKLD